MAGKNSTNLRPAPPPKAIRRIRARIVTWGKRNYQAFPWRNPARKWHGLIAEILLQRTRAASALPVYIKFIDKFPRPIDLGKASLKTIKKIIHPLGLAWRAKYLKRLGKELATGGKRVPANVETLLELSGVGAYAAAAYAGFHGNIRSVIVDANVVRVLCRVTGNQKNGETRRQRWLIQLADKLTPKDGWQAYNYAILDFSIQVCKTKPRCEICPIGPELCFFGSTVLTKKNWRYPQVAS